MRAPEAPRLEDMVRTGVVISNVSAGLLFAALAGLSAPAAVLHSCVCKYQWSSSTRESAFACDRLALSPGARKRHFSELGPALRSMKKAVRELPDGYEFQFPADPKTIAMIAEWAAGERLCCPFFDIQIRMEAEGGPVWLRLTGREGTKSFLQADAASWIKP